MKKHKNKSFNRRIIVTTSLVNLAFWLVACLAGAFVMHEEYEEAFDGALRLSAARLLPIVLNILENNNLREDNQPAPLSSPEYSTYQLLDRRGNLLLRSSHAPEQAYGVPIAPGFFRNREWRIYSLASRDGAFFIQVGDRMAERREAAWEALVALALPAVIFIPLTMLVMAILLRRQLRPIQDLSALIGKKDSGNMQPIDATGMQQEFLPIIASVNHLLGRLKSALTAERAFTANSAHEIRTPIAGALAHTQLLRASLPKCYQARAGEVEAGLQRLRHLSEKLLQLARADAHIGQADSAMDLLPFLEVVVEDFQRVGMKQRLRINCQVDRLVHQIDGDAFGIIIRNLLENALTHSPKNSPVSVTISSNSIIISNDCEALTPAILAQLGKRFYRGKQDGKGAGLGLSIVETLSHTMKIRISYLSPLDGQDRGFCATISL